jgi:GDSL-like lipase/acylhydrolase family protein
MRRAWRRAVGAVTGPRSATRLTVVLILAGAVAATIGQRELFSLGAEDSARSVRRFVLGATDVTVKPDAPWARIPAWLPGPADQWAGGTRHAITVLLEPPAFRNLVLDIRTGRTRPFELEAFPALPVDARAELRVVVSGTGIATFTIPAPSASPHGAPHGSRRLHVTIPAAALGAQTPVTVALVNDAGHGVGIEHIRLAEARPTISASHLRRAGRLPVASATLLAAGLALLLWGRLTRPDGGGRTFAWLRAAGPALGLLLLSVAASAPAVLRALPHWAWLLLILGVLPLGRRAARAEPGRRRATILLARGLGTLLLALGALVGSAVAAELALRVVFRDEPWTRSALRLPAPVVANRPHLNSLGFDERAFPLEKPAGVYRIAVLGDSLSVSAPRGQRFGDVVADRLNANPSRSLTYESVNFGRTGIDTEEETVILQHFVWRVHPDFVLLEWYVNDVENSDYSERPEVVYPISTATPFGRWLDRLTDRTLLRWMLREEYQGALEQLGLVETYPAYLHRMFSEPASPRWAIEDRALRAFFEECRAHHTPVAIALFPHLSAGLVAGAYEFAELHDQVLDLCRHENVPCVDLRATFAGRRDYASLWVHRFDAHPNALAHRLAGERLVEVLGPVWLGAARASGTAARTRVSPAGAPGFAVSRSQRS